MMSRALNDIKFKTSSWQLQIQENELIDKSIKLLRVKQEEQHGKVWTVIICIISVNICSYLIFFWNRPQLVCHHLLPSHNHRQIGKCKMGHP